MVRSALLALAALSAFATAAPALAQPLYTAALATPLTTHTVIRDARWACAGAACSAPRTGTSPDAVVCAAVAKKLGPITAFTAGDTRFDAAQLDACNGGAKATAKR